MSESLATEDDALLFFREIVEPTVDEFMADRSNRRRGCLASLVVASMVEHYLHARPDIARRGKSSFLEECRKTKDWPVAAVVDVANATKHVVRDPKRGRRSDGEAWAYTDIDVRPLNQCGVMQAGWPLGGEEVLVGLSRVSRLATLIECAMASWRDRLGIAAGTP